MKNRLKKANTYGLLAAVLLLSVLLITGSGNSDEKLSEAVKIMMPKLSEKH